MVIPRELFGRSRQRYGPKPAVFGIKKSPARVENTFFDFYLEKVPSRGYFTAKKRPSVRAAGGMTETSQSLGSQTTLPFFFAVSGPMPKRNLQSGQVTAVQRASSLLLQPQHSRHLARIATRGEFVRQALWASRRYRAGILANWAPRRLVICSGFVISALYCWAMASAILILTSTPLIALINLHFCDGLLMFRDAATVPASGNFQNCR